MLSRLLLLVLTGACLAVLLVAGGLADFVEAPTLPGTRPSADLHTAHFVPKGSRRGHSDRLSLRQLAGVEATLQDASLIVAQLTRRPLGYAGRPGGSQRIAFVAGPLWSALGARVLGQSPDWPNLRNSLAGGGARQIVLSERLAVAEFGSAKAALGQQVQLPDLMAFMTAGTADFVVVGVATGEFSGPVAEDPVAAWLPLQAWRDIILPAHQGDDVADDAADFVAVSGVASASRLTTRLNAALADDPELDHEVLLMPGVGPAPERRMALREWSAMIRAATLAVLAALAALYVCQRWLALERGRHQDQIRSFLGESPSGWWRRKLMLLGADLLLLGCAVLLVAALFWSLAAQTEMPLQAAVSEFLQADTLRWLLRVAALWLLVFAPLALHLSLARRIQNLSNRLGSYTLLLVSVALATTLLGVMLASLSIDHTQSLFKRQLGWPARVPWQAEVGPRAEDPHAYGRHTLDRRPIESLLLSSDLALATVAPLGSADPVQAQLRAGETVWRGRAQLNEITAAYLPLLGLQVQGDCPEFSELPTDTVVVNQAFLRRFAGAAPLHSIDLKLTILAEGIFPQDLRICGTVADIQYGDARGTALPMIYRRSTRVGSANVVLGRDLKAIERFRSALVTQFPDLRVGPARPLHALLAANLSQESAMARLAQALACIASLIAIVLTAQVVLLAAQLQAGTLATRWALGATRPHLLTRLLSVRSKLLLSIACLLLLSAVIIALHSVPPASTIAAWRALACGLIATITALALGLMPVWRWLSEPRLRQALASERSIES